MSTSTLLPSVRTALTAFVDYAGLFPPAKLAMRAAVQEYAGARSGAHAWMLGRFIVPASRLKELQTALGDSPVALSAIADAQNDARGWFNSAQAVFEEIASRRAAGMRIEALEVPLPPLATRRETYDATLGQCAMLAERTGLRGLPIYCELPRDDRFDELAGGTFAVLARYRLGAKIRCGGVTPEAFPSVDQVASFIAAARAEGVPFKATAGLHHPVRHYNERAGVTMHGFLNLLAAAIFARKADGDDLRRILAEEDAGAFRFDDRRFAWRTWSASIEEIAEAREHGFVAYGSCSFSEPVDDLSALDILPK